MTATQEANLSAKIKEIDEIWSVTEFELRSHRKDREGGAGRQDIDLITGTEELNL